MITFCFYLFYPASQVFWSWGRMNCSHNDIPYMTVKVIRAFSSHPATRTYYGYYDALCHLISSFVPIKIITAPRG